MKRIFIYDLDRTVINSDHRTPYHENGDLNLDLYYKNKNLIDHDTLLPLVNTMRHQYKKGHHIYICTARTIDARDTSYLKFNEVPYHQMLSRPWGDASGDAILKRNLILSVLPNIEMNKRVPVTMYDDNKSVLDMLPDIGIIGINSIDLNRRFQQ